jgi:CO/xanthine dehydrogenase Mo-binding subunit
VGQFESALAGADVKIDQEYATPYQSSQPMAPHACLAVPDGKNLTLYVSAQIVAEARTKDPNYRDYAIYAYGAHFAEVGVDVDTAEVRLRRMLGVFSLGRGSTPRPRLPS